MREVYADLKVALIGELNGTVFIDIFLDIFHGKCYIFLKSAWRPQWDFLFMITGQMSAMCW